MAGTNLPSQEETVALMESNNIGKLRIFDENSDILKAYTNSGIEIIVSVTNDELQGISSYQEAADQWVEDNIRAYYPATKIKYIAVGEQALEKPDLGKYVLPALDNIQFAVRKAGLQDKIKVSTTNGRAATPASLFPSEGVFSDDVENKMRSFLQFLEDNGSPFMANVYPFHVYRENTSISLDYALFKSTAPIVRDEGRIYSNLFDGMVDGIYSAMEALGFTNIPIVVTGSGWPSYGTGETAHFTTTENAETYNNNLIKHVLSNAGTPKRPGKGLEVFIFALFNENDKTGDEFERHFGLFNPDKTPVYPVNFYP